MLDRRNGPHCQHGRVVESVLEAHLRPLVNRHGVVALLLDTDGRLGRRLSAMPSANAAEDIGRAPGTDSDRSLLLQGMLTAEQPTLLAGLRIVVGAPAGWAQPRVRTLIMVVVSGIALALLLAAVITPLAARSLSRAIGALANRAHQVARGNSVSWPRHWLIEELHGLSGDLERMVAQISRRGERLERILESSSAVAVQWYDPNGKVLYWNHASELLYGFSQIQAMGACVRDTPLMFVDRRQASDFVTTLAKIATSGEGLGPLEFPLRHRDGTNLVVLANVFRVQDDEGAPMLVCMDIDVTERQQMASALRANEQQLEAVFNASPAPMSVSDAVDDYRIVAVNQAWEQQFGRRLVL